MGQRIVYDGFNLTRPHGTGVATYARTLAELAGELGHETGVLYGVAQLPAAASSVADVALGERPVGWGLDPRAVLTDIGDQLRCARPIQPIPLALAGEGADASGAVVRYQRRAYAARNVFNNARRYFARTGRFVELEFEEPPDIFHATYPLPVHASGARNIQTIHDVISLKLPFAMNDEKGTTRSLLGRIAARADRIVTVSETSKRDLVEIAGVDAARVIVTYQAVQLPPQAFAWTAAEVAARLVAWRLDPSGYLLFFGALEPKKNVRRLIEAYLTAKPGIPLVLVSGGGWSNEAETRLIAENRDTIRRIAHLDRESLACVIRGARAVLFPSLYEGFGLPVIEAMTLGTPVVTSRGGALGEVAGQAALFVDPYDTGDIARAITTMTADAGLRADYAERGRAQAATFSVERYRERIVALYAALS